MKQVKRQVTHKSAQAAAAVADTTTTTSPSSQDAAATNEDELEEQMAADAVDEEGASGEEEGPLCQTCLERALEHCPTAPYHAWFGRVVVGWQKGRLDRVVPGPIPREALG